MYWKHVKEEIVFCLILTELFLLKYTHKHMVNLCFFIWCTLIYSITFFPQTDAIS